MRFNLKNSLTCLGLLLVALVLLISYWQAIHPPTQLVEPPLKLADFQLSSAMVPGIYDSSEFTSSSLAASTSTTTSTGVAVLVSHHLLAQELISEQIRAVCSADVHTVVIISPDHFGYLRSRPLNQSIAVAHFNWQTPRSYLLVDQFLASQLAQLPMVQLTNQPADLGQEHGIFAIIPFIEQWCGKPNIVAMVARAQDSDKTLEEVGQLIFSYSEQMQQKTLVVISSDFTHEKPLTIANQLDAKSAEVIEMLTDKTATPDFSAVTSDCPACLVILRGYLASLREPVSLTLKHQSSANYGGNPQNVTSYFGGVWRLQLQN